MALKLYYLLLHFISENVDHYFDESLFTSNNKSLQDFTRFDLTYLFCIGFCCLFHRADLWHLWKTSLPQVNVQHDDRLETLYTQLHGKG